MSASTGPQYLRDVAMGLRRMGFPISAPSLEQLAAQWDADRAALERARALADELQHYAEGKDAEMSATMGAVVGTMRGIGDRLAAALSEPDGAR